MKKARIEGLAVVLAVTAVFVMHASVAIAKENLGSNRSGDMEFSLPIIYTNSTTIDGSGGSYADLNSDWSPGFGVGYNINQHFLINGLFTWSSRGYDAKIVRGDGSTSKYNGTMESSTISLNGTYFILDRDVTPFVSGGIGWTFMDTNIPSGSGQSYCYWDPWWGYVCDTYVPTKTEDQVSYNAGLGLRWDITTNFSLQGSYSKMWIDISGAKGGMPDFNVYKVDLVFRSKP